MIKILAILGKSASGKTTFINELVENNPEKYHVVKSFTTRAERKDDPADKTSHEFVTEYEFFKVVEEERATNMYSSPKGYFSWTTLESFSKDKINLFAISPDSFVDALENNEYPLRGLATFEGVYMDITENERMKRYLKRQGNLKGWSEEQHLSKDILRNHLSKIQFIK